MPALSVNDEAALPVRRLRVAPVGLWRGGRRRVLHRLVARLDHARISRYCLEQDQRRDDKPLRFGKRQVPDESLGASRLVVLVEVVHGPLRVFWTYSAGPIRSSNGFRT